MSEGRPFTVLFVQCQEKRQLPHMNMPLFVRDLEQQGCRVECVCLHAPRLHWLTRLLQERPVDLLGIEHMAPYGVVNRARAVSPGTKIVVGGNGFLDVFAKTDVDFGVAGAGRESISSLAAALRGDGAIADVPNLFFKRRLDGVTTIDCGDRVVDLSLSRELRPYVPDLDWRYLGFGGSLPPLRRRGSPPTIVADLGCACRSRTTGVECASGSLTSARFPISERARERLAALEAQRLAGGCSFCTYGGYSIASVDETLGLAVEQMEFLQERYGFERFSIGSEEPFRFLLPLLRRAVDEGIAIRQVLLRSRVDWLLRFREVLEEAIRFAREHRFQLAVWQVGFESFSNRHLEIYGKDQSVDDNLAAIRLLDDLERRHEGWFATSVRSHGFLGSTPWTTIDDVDEQLRVIEGLPRRWRCAVLGGPVKLFDELLPFSREVQRDGLLVRRTAARNRFRFVDDRVRIVEQTREHFARRSRQLADGFFWRSALEEYWEEVRTLLTTLRQHGTSRDREERRRVLDDARRAIDRRIDPIIAAYRGYKAGARRESAGRYREALRAYRNANTQMAGNCAIVAAMSRAAHALGHMGWARRYAREAIQRLEAEQALHPHEPVIDLLLAQCLARVGESERAARHLGSGVAKRRACVVGGD